MSDGWRDSDRHRLSDLVLHVENVSEVAVVALGPDMIASQGLDQLCGYPDAVAGFAQAALKDIPDTEVASDFLHIDRAAFVGEARITGEDGGKTAGGSQWSRP